MAKTDFEIEKAIPLPPSSYGGGRKCKYPWSDMGPGDSFVVPLNGESASVIRRRISSAAAIYGKRKNLKFTMRITEQGIRVWRIS